MKVKLLWTVNVWSPAVNGSLPFPISLYTHLLTHIIYPPEGAAPSPTILTLCLQPPPVKEWILASRSGQPFVFSNMGARHLAQAVVTELGELSAPFVTSQGGFGSPAVCPPNKKVEPAVKVACQFGGITLFLEKHCILQCLGPLNSLNTCLMKPCSAVPISLPGADVPVCEIQRFYLFIFFRRASAAARL